MPKLSLAEIAGAIGAEAPGGTSASATAAGYAVDSRLLKAGEMFFALKGTDRDGRQFARDAYAKGAVAVVVDAPVDDLPRGFPQLVVRSTMDALQRLAVYVRGGVNIPVIAVTGSNGKTTTKEMIAFVLGTKMGVRRSPGNFNNHIGLPLSVLALEASDRALVVEMGTNHPGEIAGLAKIARPDIAVMTNVGRAHIGFFGSLEAIAREKADLARGLEPGGKAVVNADDGVLMDAVARTPAEIITFGINRPADFMAANIEPLPGGRSKFALHGIGVELQAGGTHNIYNALAAMAASHLLGVSVKDAAAALPRYEPVRMKARSYGGVTLIDDAYNANPDSVAAALEVLAGAAGGRRVFIMGDMLELGEATERLHREVGSMVARLGIDLLIGIGEATLWTVEEARAGGLPAERALHFMTKADAKRDLKRMVRPDDVVLVKASRMSGLEEISDFLRLATAAGRI
ncbi:MAG: UDP-N-acetylmuramoyl-tripeptide--D-alanyl-D-alanine ligase [bacterium]